MLKEANSIGNALRALRRQKCWNDYRARYLEVARLLLPSMLEDGLATLAPASTLPSDTRAVLERYAAGGKKLRGALVLIGYQCVGGDRLSAVARSSVAYELLHAAFLVHDDIMDKSETRRGERTAHREFAALAKRYKVPDSEQFGLSMAINTGDVGPALAYDVVCSEPIAPQRKVAGIRHLNRVIVDTILGQSLDVGTSIDSQPSEERILEIHKLKTAVYTVSGALQFGGILAGGEETKQGRQVLAAMASYGIPVGIAFQIQDDYLGTFSTRKELGKSVTSDLEEKKNTLLFHHTLEHGTEEQRRVLLAALGRPNLTRRELTRVKRAIRDSGAVEYSQQQASRLVNESRRHIKSITTDPSLQRLLHEISEFVLDRQS